MPIKNCTFRNPDDEGFYIWLPISIINPHTGQSYKTNGIIDTGATDTSIPAEIATLLSHNLELGESVTIGTGNGDATGFRHINY